MISQLDYLYTLAQKWLDGILSGPINSRSMPTTKSLDIPNKKHM